MFARLKDGTDRFSRARPAMTTFAKNICTHWSHGALWIKAFHQMAYVGCHTVCARGTPKNAGGSISEAEFHSKNESAPFALGGG